MGTAYGETYEQKSARRPGIPREAVFLTIGSAIVTIVVLTLMKAMAAPPEAPKAAATFTGIRHEAVSEEREMVHSADQAQDASDATVVRNGVTVLSPKLRIPIIDAAALEAATKPEETSMRKVSVAVKRPRHVRVYRSHGQNSVAARRWRAGAFATR